MHRVERINALRSLEPGIRVYALRLHDQTLSGRQFRVVLSSSGTGGLEEIEIVIVS